jgi:hypothetical protein
MKIWAAPRHQNLSGNTEPLGRCALRTILTYAPLSSTYRQIKTDAKLVCEVAFAE